MFPDHYLIPVVSPGHMDIWTALNELIRFYNYDRLLGDINIIHILAIVFVINY